MVSLGHNELRKHKWHHIITISNNADVWHIAPCVSWSICYAHIHWVTSVSFLCPWSMLYHKLIAKLSPNVADKNEEKNNTSIPDNIFLFEFIYNLWFTINEQKLTQSYAIFVIPPTSTKLKGGYTGITLSVRPSVRLSVCGQNRVRSVSSTILIGSISYLHILSSN